MKKEWQTPELVVLFKGRPEETLLCHCKHKTAPPVAVASPPPPAKRARPSQGGDELNIIVVAARRGPRLSKTEFASRTALLDGRLAPPGEMAEFAAAL